jgi:hypothetical protein
LNELIIIFFSIKEESLQEWAGGLQSQAAACVFGFKVAAVLIAENIHKFLCCCLQ